MMKKKRRLKKWVRNTLEFICCFFLSLVMVFGLMWMLTEAHYQRLEYYQELASAYPYK